MEPLLFLVNGLDFKERGAFSKGDVVFLQADKNRSIMQKIECHGPLKFTLIYPLRFCLFAAWAVGWAAQVHAQEPIMQSLDLSKEGRDPQLEGEKHFRNLMQLTFGGDNAEAYWSFDSKRLVFQSNFRDWKVECDQIFMFDVLRQGVRPGWSVQV